MEPLSVFCKKFDMPLVNPINKTSSILAVSFIIFTTYYLQSYDNTPSIENKKNIKQLTLLPKVEQKVCNTKKELNPEEKNRIKKHLEPIVLESFEEAFRGNFIKSNMLLQAQKKTPNLSSLEKKIIYYQIHKRIQFIEKIEKISLWPPLRPCKCLSIKEYKEEVKTAWIRSISLNSKEIIMPLKDLLELIRVGVSKQWFIGQNFFVYKNLLQTFLRMLKHQNEKIIFSEIMANACIQLKEFNEAERIRDECLKPLLSENLKQRISNLLDITFEFQNFCYPHLVTRTYKIVFNALKQIPFEFNLCLIAFRQMLVCLKDNLEDTKWALSEMENFVKDIKVEGEVAADEKAELLRIIQQDLIVVYFG